MGTGYTRQSTALIQDGQIIYADGLNDEFDLLDDFADGTIGHSHDGTTGEGPKINLTTSITGVLPVANGGTAGINKIDGTTAPGAGDDNLDGYGPGSIWVDTTNDRVYICVDASTGAAIWQRYEIQDATLDALAALDTTAGLLAQVGADTFAKRAIVAPAAGITVSNGAGTAGNPTLALANDLSAVEGLGGTGLTVRTATDTWNTRSITGTSNEITVTNGDGVSGSPTIGLASAINLAGKTISNAGFITSTTFTSTDASATVGPVVTLDRNSASPAVSDDLGQISFTGRDSNGNVTDYGKIKTSINFVTDGSEIGKLSLIGVGSSTDCVLELIGNGAALFTNGLTVQNGLSISSVGLSINGGGLTVGSGHVSLNPGNNFTISSGTFTLSSGNIVVSSGTITSSGAIATSGSFVGSSGGTNAILASTGAGNIFFRPNGAASTTGQVSIDSGGLVTLNGGQIAFPASQNASANANTLDDYEEGTFTPTISGSTSAGTGTYTTQQGVYTKIGNLVHFHGTITWTAHTGTGNLRLTALPFTAASGSNVPFSISYSNLTYTSQVTAAVIAGQAYGEFFQAATNAAVANIAIEAGATISFSGCYTV